MSDKRKEEWFIHLRVDQGAATLCVRGDLVGVAFCSPTEQFSRKIGRAISSGRARKVEEAGGDEARYVFHLDVLPERDVARYVTEVFGTWVEALDGADRPQWLAWGMPLLMPWRLDRALEDREVEVEAEEAEA